jgi:EAL domain-containing protein (putative c-di-GMP-specific phosphodiesterase class I)
MIPPSESIPIAEETGLIGPLGEWVLRTACDEAASWPNDMKVPLNVSPVQFGDSLVQTVGQCAGIFAVGARTARL